MKSSLSGLGLLCILGLSSLGFVQFRSLKKGEKRQISSFGGKDSLKRHCYKMNKTVHDFGSIVEGINVITYFKLTNCGNDTLIIQGLINDGCGCSWFSGRKNPILPGETREFKYEYNSSSRVGSFHKQSGIEIVGMPIIEVTINGIVVPDTRRPR